MGATPSGATYHIGCFVRAALAAILNFGRDLEEVYICPHTHEVTEALKTEIFEALKDHSSALDFMAIACQAFVELTPVDASGRDSGGTASPYGGVLPQDTTGLMPTSYEVPDPDKEPRRMGPIRLRLEDGGR